MIVHTVPLTEATCSTLAPTVTVITIMIDYDHDRSGAT